MRFSALLAKDFRLLFRTPSITVLLIFYPALVAILMGLAVGKPPAKPHVILVNEVPKKERKIKVGGKRFDLDKLTNQLFDNVDVTEVKTKSDAIKTVKSGDAVAAIVIPKDIGEKLASATAQGNIEAYFDTSNAVRKAFVETTIKGVLVDTNRELTKRFRDQTLDYLDIINKGGNFSGGGRSGKISGLKEGTELLPTLLPYIPEAKRKKVQDLAQTLAIAGIGVSYSNQLLNRIGEPIKLDRNPLGASSSVPALAIAVAVSVSLMFVALLLGAGMLAFEQEDQMLSRLLRGLISRTSIVAEKTLLAGICAAFVGALMVCGFGIFVDLRFDRAWAWLPAIAMGSLALGVAGVAIGATSRDVRAASLVSFMVGLPLAAAALIPKGTIGPAMFNLIQIISDLFPFKPAFQLITAGLTPGVDGGGPLIHLIALTLVYGTIATLAIRRYQYS
jgi:ABC-2 type transport system permease protein